MNPSVDSAPSRSDGGALVHIQSITKHYGHHGALADVSLRVNAGDFLVLLGPSGSGKTTLLRCVAGIERISEGAIHLDGTLVDNGRYLVPPERRDLAMVFQDYALWPHLTARQNVAYALRRRHLSSREADRRAAEMLARVGLSALIDRYPGELSGGEQQRVALARALVAEPRLLLFDEPLSNLDASLRERMRVEIATLVREVGATALYITHDQTEAFALADQVGVLEHGRLVQFGTPEAIYAGPVTPFVARLTGLAGELPGRVVRALSDGTVTVAIGGGHVVTPTSQPLQPGDPVRILIRPSAVHLHPPTSGDAHVVGEIQDVAFCGRGYDHVIALPDGCRLAGVFASERWERGSRVGVQFDATGCIIFQTEEREVSRPAPPIQPRTTLGERFKAALPGLKVRTSRS